MRYGYCQCISNKFIFPFDFEMLDSMIPHYQLGLRNRLCYKIMLNDYDLIIASPGSLAKPDAKYKIMDVSLGYQIVTKPDLTRCNVMEYQSMALPYNRVLRDGQIPMNNLDMTWSQSFNMTCRSLKGILVFRSRTVIGTRHEQVL